MSLKRVAASIVFGIVSGAILAFAIFGPDKLDCIYGEATGTGIGLDCKDLTDTQIKAYTRMYQAHNLANQGKHAEAIAIYRYIQGIEPTVGHILADVGHHFVKNRQYDTAIVYLTEFINSPEAAPQPDKLAGARSQRGRAYAELERHDEALADFNAALNLDPTNARVLMRRAAAYRKMDKVDLALADLDVAASVDKENSFVYWTRSKLRAESGNFDGALEDVDAAIRIRPQEARFYRHKAVMLIEHQSFDDALTSVESMEYAVGKTWESEMLRGRILFERGQLKPAVEALDRSIALSSNDAASYMVRGRAKGDLGNTQSALADFEKARELGDQDAQHWINRYTQIKGR